MQLTGKIIHGEGRGKGLGFPTINVEGAFSDLEQGVYAVWVDLNGSRYKGAMNYGPQPTFEDGKVRVEVFLLNFEGDLYGETVTVEPVERIRSVIKFESVEALRAQIDQDIVRVEQVLYNSAT